MLYQYPLYSHSMKYLYCLFQNQNNAINSWNNNYNLPQGFDPTATPGYGFNYEQWLHQQLTA